MTNLTTATTEQPLLYLLVWRFPDGSVTYGIAAMPLEKVTARVEYWNEKQPELDHWYEPAGEVEVTHEQD